MPARLKRWGIIVLALLIVVGISFVFVATPSEPIFNGIRLSEILSDGSVFNFWNNPTNYPVGRLAQNSLGQKQRVYLLAFHHMGDAAWPVLLNELQAKDSKLKTWLIRRARSQKWVRITIMPANERVAIAMLATRDLATVPPKFKHSIDPTWRGLKESSRQKILLDLVNLLTITHPDDRESATICFLLGTVDANKAAAISALKQAAGDGVPGAKEALKSILENDRGSMLPAVRQPSLPEPDHAALKTADPRPP